MENQIKILGKQNFMGIQIPVISGGFGENQKVILAKTIAEIHGVRSNDIQDLINNNIDEFEFGIDVLDLCDENFKTDAVGLGFITSNRQKHCYLLSEQGYMALVSLMKTPKAKEIRRQLRREYFAMREVIQSNPNNINAQLAGMVQSTMTAIMPIVIEQFAPIVLQSKEQVDNMAGLIHDQSEIHTQNVNQIKSLIGFKSANTRRIVDTIKDMLSEKYGYKIYKKDKAFLKVKKEVFKRFEVIKWEDIPVEKFNQVFAFVDTYIEDLKVCC